MAILLKPEMVERDENGIAHIVALSGGKDSTAMALWLAENEPRPYTYICTPTGNELPEMFDHWKSLSAILGKPIYPLVAGTLKSVQKDEGMLPNYRARFCTRKLKIEPYIAFMLTVKPAVSYVGLRADEPEREGTLYDNKDGGIIQDFPLRRLGWGLFKVQEYNRSKGVDIPARTDCAWCFFQMLSEWYLLWLNHPGLFQEAVDIEEEFGHTYRTPGRDTWPSALKDLRKEFERGRVPKGTQMDLFKQAQCRECRI
jgi:3'-phosphoadenosine 5'-phosphosulfate sulfotransferase (PAPS reductase)/FAD synthetase